jgi:hypothetical protein
MVGSVTVIGSATIDRIEQPRSTTVKMGGVVVYSGIIPEPWSDHQSGYQRSRPG